MSKSYNYSSSFAQPIQQFLLLKKSTGQACAWLEKCLKELDRYALSACLDKPDFTRESVEEWRKTLSNNQPSTIYKKISVLAMLARFMNRNGYNTFVPQLPKKEQKSFVPYIFTEEQIDKLFHVCDTRTPKAHDLHSTFFAMPSLLRLLYSTGLRISEALSIRNSDVHMADLYIHIRKSKTDTERLVPISDSLKKVLCQYEHYRNLLPISNSSTLTAFYFIKPDGTKISSQAVYGRFRELLEKCNIPHYGKGNGPRVHDLRHTFAVHSLVQLGRSNMDLYTALPILSACLGHKCISSTELYVRLTSSMYPDLEEKCSPINTFIYPKLRYHEEAYDY